MEKKRVQKKRNVVFIVLHDADYAAFKEIADQERTSVPRIARAVLAHYLSILKDVADREHITVPRVTRLVLSEYMEAKGKENNDSE